MRTTKTQSDHDKMVNARVDELVRWLKCQKIQNT